MTFLFSVSKCQPNLTFHVICHQTIPMKDISWMGIVSPYRGEDIGHSWESGKGVLVMVSALNCTWVFLKIFANTEKNISHSRLDQSEPNWFGDTYTYVLNDGFTFFWSWKTSNVTKVKRLLYWAFTYSSFSWQPWASLFLLLFNFLSYTQQILSIKYQTLSFY